MDMEESKNSLVVFSTSPQEREHLRNKLAHPNANVFCFSNEVTCFENLDSIQPDLVIARSDSQVTAWRFIFVMHAQGAGVPLAIASNRLRNEFFGLSGLNVPVHCLPLTGYGEKFYRGLDTIRQSKREASPANGHSLLVGDSAFLQRVRMDLPRLTGSNETILLYGEKGTGKELLSRLIADRGGHRCAFIKINCADLAPARESGGKTIYQSPLYSHGNSWFAAAHLQPGSNVCILLDRVDALSENVPSQLMFLLEEIPNRLNARNAGGVGSIRFIATCEGDFERIADTGMFRRDLYYRLNVIPIHIPPLRERKEDIPLLVDYFMSDACVENNKSFRIASPDVIERMYCHDWPGNLDELRTAVQRIAFTGNGLFLTAPDSHLEIDKRLHAHILQAFDADAASDLDAIKRSLPDMSRLSLKSVCNRFVVRIEKKLLRKALETTHWNRKKAAEILNISYKSMLNKIKAYDIV
jgi:DNA-binding NtrC family response regulator